MSNRLLWLSATVSWCLLLSGQSAAKNRNPAFLGCTGCHGGNEGADVSVGFDPPSPDPGDEVTFTITITGPNIGVGGFSLFTGGEGTLVVPAGENIGVDEQFATHNSPKSASGGSVQYKVGWRAPTEPGGTLFVLSVIAGNGNGSSSGDYPAQTEFSLAYGCEGQEYYYDGDRDGWGNSEWGTIMDCSVPEGYAEMDGDCNENSATIHPGAEEACNNRDDNCDGEVDENAVIKARYPDVDGDGYGDSNGEVIMDCVAPAGYADEGGDCSDLDPEIYPGAEEVCDFLDNDCDGDVDDGARDVCGEGLCIRESQSCYSECIPGQPLLERCNGWDDDCDGEIDENESCPEGQGCFQYECVDLEIVDDLLAEEAMQADMMASATDMSSPVESSSGDSGTQSSSGDAIGTSSGGNSSSSDSTTSLSSSSSSGSTDGTAGAEPDTTADAEPAGGQTSPSGSETSASPSVSTAEDQAGTGEGGSSGCTSSHGGPSGNFPLFAGLALALATLRRARRTP